LSIERGRERLLDSDLLVRQQNPSPYSFKRILRLRGIKNIITDDDKDLNNRINTDPADPNGLTAKQQKIIDGAIETEIAFYKFAPSTFDDFYNLAKTAEKLRMHLGIQVQEANDSDTNYTTEAQVDLVNENWDPDTITWNNQPDPASYIHTQKVRVSGILPAAGSTTYSICRVPIMVPILIGLEPEDIGFGLRLSVNVLGDVPIQEDDQGRKRQLVEFNRGFHFFSIKNPHEFRISKLGRISDVMTVTTKEKHRFAKDQFVRFFEILNLPNGDQIFLTDERVTLILDDFKFTIDDTGDDFAEVELNPADGKATILAWSTEV